MKDAALDRTAVPAAEARARMNAGLHVRTATDLLVADMPGRPEGETATCFGLATRTPAGYLRCEQQLGFDSDALAVRGGSGAR